jgi:hypothetical protein
VTIIALGKTFRTTGEQFEVTHLGVVEAKTTRGASDCVLGTTRFHVNSALIADMLTHVSLIHNNLYF